VSGHRTGRRGLTAVTSYRPRGTSPVASGSPDPSLPALPRRLPWGRSPIEGGSGLGPCSRRLRRSEAPTPAPGIAGGLPDGQGPHAALPARPLGVLAGRRGRALVPVLHVGHGLRSARRSARRVRRLPGAAVPDRCGAEGTTLCVDPGSPQHALGHGRAYVVGEGDYPARVARVGPTTPTRAGRLVDTSVDHTEAHKSMADDPVINRLGCPGPSPPVSTWIG
jgi:hypothetical protein